MHVEWNIDLKIKVDGNEVDIDKLPPMLAEQVVFEALDNGLYSKSGEFNHEWE